MRGEKNVLSTYAALKCAELVRFRRARDTGNSRRPVKCPVQRSANRQREVLKSFLPAAAPWGQQVLSAAGGHLLEPCAFFWVVAFRAGGWGWEGVGWGWRCLFVFFKFLSLRLLKKENVV